MAYPQGFCGTQCTCTSVRGRDAQTVRLRRVGVASRERSQHAHLRPSHHGILQRRSAEMASMVSRDREIKFSMIWPKGIPTLPAFTTRTRPTLKQRLIGRMKLPSRPSNDGTIRLRHRRGFSPRHFIEHSGFAVASDERSPNFPVLLKASDREPHRRQQRRDLRRLDESLVAPHPVQEGSRGCRRARQLAYTCSPAWKEAHRRPAPKCVGRLYAIACEWRMLSPRASGGSRQRRARPLEYGDAARYGVSARPIGAQAGGPAGSCLRAR